MKLKVSAVSYINTLPFLYGLEKMPEIELSVDYPALTAQKLISGQVDIGLVPVIVWYQKPQFINISDYCIGADGKVASVLLLSNNPINSINTILLDYQSQTSNNLTKVLAKFYWKINPKYKLQTNENLNLQNHTAAVIIGDRAFKYKKLFNFNYDLAEEWKKFTNLPFVFALWLANKKIPKNFIQKFNQALELGLKNIPKVLQIYQNKIQSYQKLFNIQQYLTKFISYNFSEEKHLALKKFFQYLKQL